MSKPLRAYRDLSHRRRRLVNKLILYDTISDKEFNAINRIINRGRRGSGDTGARYNNGYLEFYREQYPDFRKEHQDMQVTDIAREMGKQWKALSAPQQQIYRDRIQ